MKLPFILLFALLSVAGYSKQPTNTRLTVYFGDCRNPDDMYTSGDTLSVFDSQNRLAKTYTFGVNNGRLGAIIVDSLTPGGYRLEYRNQYSQRLTKNVIVSNGVSNHETLCLDSAAAYKANTLARMQDGDSLVIYYTSSGCFNYDKLELIIVKKSGTFTASLFVLVADRKPALHDVDAGKKLAKKAILTEKQIAAFVRFENEIGLISKGGCTTKDTYSISSKYLNGEFNDTSCQWNGFDFLTRTFFPHRK